MIRKSAKVLLNAVALAAALPFAALSFFGRVKSVYTITSHCVAMFPGVIGDYLRAGYYHLTLQEFGLSSRISFGSFFAHPEARVGANVYIGSYCIMGKVHIGSGTQIGSAVQILSGQHQHLRDESGAVHHKGDFVFVTVGVDCWVGAAAIVMADVGERSTVGAASVVTRPVPSDSVAVGSPARVIRGPQTAEPKFPALVAKE